MQKAWLFQLTNISSRRLRVGIATNSTPTLNSDVEPSQFVSTSQDITDKVMSVKICKPFLVSLYPLLGFENKKHIADQDNALVKPLSVESNDPLSNSAINGFLLGTQIGFKQKAKSFPDRIRLFKALISLFEFVLGCGPKNITGRMAKFHYY